MTTVEAPTAYADLVRAQVRNEFHASQQQCIAMAVGYDSRNSKVRSDVADVSDAIRVALTEEQTVTEQIEALFAKASAEEDFLGEQFMLWFLSEQVEEVASMSTLLTIAERAGTDWFEVETSLAREKVGDSGHSEGPAAAGGNL